MPLRHASRMFAMSISSYSLSRTSATKMSPLSPISRRKARMSISFCWPATFQTKIATSIRSVASTTPSPWQRLSQSWTRRFSSSPTVRVCSLTIRRHATGCSASRYPFGNGFSTYSSQPWVLLFYRRYLSLQPLPSVWRARGRFCLSQSVWVLITPSSISWNSALCMPMPSRAWKR